MTAITSASMAIDPGKARWKIQTWNRNREKPQALYVPYFDARDVADHLDSLFGWDGWSDELTFQELKGSSFAVCRLTVHPKHDPAATAETGWRGGVTKTDAAPLTDFEAVKGGASDAFKRAAAKLGVGRNAYAMPTFWGPCEIRGEGEKARPTIPRGYEERLRRMALAQIKAGTVDTEPVEDDAEPARPPVRKVQGR